MTTKLVNYQIYNPNIKEREILDCTTKGNVIRFYLGKNGTQTGEDWNECNYESYAGNVRDEYVGAVKDIYVPYDDVVLTPADIKNSWKYGCGYSKDDLKERKIPCFMIVPAKAYVDEYESDYFDRYLDNPEVRKYYFGDIL